MQKAKVSYVPGQLKTGTHRVLSQPIYTGDKPGAGDASCSDISITEEIDQLQEYFKSWEGVRYRYGGVSTKGIDCSGLTLRAYKELYGVDLPRTVTGQSKKGIPVKKTSLQPGDLIFFKTGRLARHVGIYVGENSFIHASRSKGVIQSSLDNTYWRKRYWQAKRVQSVSSY